MTSSPGFRMAFSTVLSAAPAPTVIKMWSAVYGRPVAALTRRATASRTFGWPALGMYACRWCASLSSTRRAAASTAAGGSISGLPSVKSKTLSAPRSCLSRAPSSNIRRIHDARLRLSATALAMITGGSIALGPSGPRERGYGDPGDAAARDRLGHEPRPLHLFHERAQVLGGGRAALRRADRLLDAGELAVEQ